MAIYYKNERFLEDAYRLESELERDVVNNSKMFFGSNSIYIDAKKKIEAKALGGSIPDGFLFDFSDMKNPNFYIVEAELSKHDFYGHIFPQITKFIAFFNNRKSQNDLVNKLHALVSEDREIKQQFSSIIGEQELYKFIKDTIENSQNILIIIDAEKKELPDIMETYSETWGAMVKLLILKRYSNGVENVYTLEPEFENVEYSVMKIEEEASSNIVKEYTEESHTNYANEDVRDIYFKIKNRILTQFPEATFNVTKRYISVVAQKRTAIFRFKKKFINLVLMKEEALVKQKIPSYKIKSLGAGVQTFWNGPCCEVQLNNANHLEEVMDVIVDMINHQISTLD